MLDSEFKCLENCTVQEVSHDINCEGALIQVINGVFQYSQSLITNVSINNSIGIWPVISLQNSDLTMNYSSVDEFSGRLLNAIQGSKVVVVATII